MTCFLVLFGLMFRKLPVVHLFVCRFCPDKFYKNRAPGSCQSWDTPPWTNSKNTVKNIKGLLKKPTLPKHQLMFYDVKLFLRKTSFYRPKLISLSRFVSEKNFEKNEMFFSEMKVIDFLSFSKNDFGIFVTMRLSERKLIQCS